MNFNNNSVKISNVKTYSAKNNSIMFKNTNMPSYNYDNIYEYKDVNYNYNDINLTDTATGTTTKDKSDLTPRSKEAPVVQAVCSAIVQAVCSAMQQTLHIWDPKDLIEESKELWNRLSSNLPSENKKYVYLEYEPGVKIRRYKFDDKDITYIRKGNYEYHYKNGYCFAIVEIADTIIKGEKLWEQVGKKALDNCEKGNINNTGFELNSFHIDVSNNYISIQDGKTAYKFEKETGNLSKVNKNNEEYFCDNGYLYNNTIRFLEQKSYDLEENGDWVLYKNGEEVCKYKNGDYAYIHPIENDGTEFSFYKNVKECKMYDGENIKVFSQNENGIYEEVPVSIYGEYTKENWQYGGDQGSINNTLTWLEDDTMLDILETYFPDATKEDYELYLTAISNVGCAYTAFINMVFKNFEGREEEFEKTFGFPMYTVNSKKGVFYGDIDFNYEYLIVDLVSYYWSVIKDNNYTIQDLYGDIGTGESNNSRKHFDGELDGMYLQEGFEWLEEKYKLKLQYDILPRAREIEYDPSWDPNMPEEEKSHDQKYWESQYQYFLEHIKERKERDPDYKLSCNGFIFTEDFKGSFTERLHIYDYEEMIKKCQALYPGKRINVTISGDFVYYDRNGTKRESNLGPHASTVTGVTEDGDLIISTWGQEYILKKDEADKAMVLVTCLE